MIKVSVTLFSRLVICKLYVPELWVDKRVHVFNFRVWQIPLLCYYLAMKVISDKGKKDVLPFPENQLKSESNENTAETRGRRYFHPSSAASQ